MQRSDLKGMIFWITVEEVLGLLLVSHWPGRGYLLGVDARDPMPWRPWVSLCPCQPGRLHASVWEQDPEGIAHMCNKTYPYLSLKQGWAQHSELGMGHLQTQGCEAKCLLESGHVSLCPQWALLREEPINKTTESRWNGCSNIWSSPITEYISRK